MQAASAQKTVRDEDRDNIIKWLKRYDHITIREKSGVELAKSLGVDAEQVLDPTFLMTPQNWLDTLPKKREKGKLCSCVSTAPK